MPRPSLCRSAVIVLLGGLLIFVPACSSPTLPPPVEETAEAVRGKVTYDGNIVPFGYVLFYSFETSFDPKAKGFFPRAFAPIGADGSYEVQGVPLGLLKVCVFTDPEADLAKVLGPKPLGGAPGGGAPGGPRGGPSGKQPNSSPGAPQGVSAGHSPIHRANPRLRDLKPEEIQMLKDISTKYGTFTTSPLVYHAHPGDQTFDLELKSDPKREKARPKQ